MTGTANRRTYGRMPKRKEPPLPPKAQFKRFVEAAREHEVDESGKEFERTFARVAKRKPATSSRKSARRD